MVGAMKKCKEGIVKKPHHDSIKKKKITQHTDPIPSHSKQNLFEEDAATSASPSPLESKNEDEGFYVNGAKSDILSDSEPLRDDFIRGDKPTFHDSNQEESDEEELEIKNKSHILDAEKEREHDEVDVELKLNIQQESDDFTLPTTYELQEEG